MFVPVGSRSKHCRSTCVPRDHGDRRAVQLDGGRPEDVTRSLGLVADTQPRRFLLEAKRSAQTERQLRAIVRMLPQNVVDDDAARPTGGLWWPGRLHEP